MQTLPYTALPAKVDTESWLPVYYYRRLDGEGLDEWVVEAYIPAEYERTPSLEACLARLFHCGAPAVEITFVTDCPLNRRWGRETT